VWSCYKFVAEMDAFERMGDSGLKKTVSDVWQVPYIMGLDRNIIPGRAFLDPWEVVYQPSQDDTPVENGV